MASLLVALCLCTPSSASVRHLHAVTVPQARRQMSVPFDARLQLMSDDLPLEDSRIRKQSAGCEAAEQVHLTYWSSTSVLVSWATCDARLGATRAQPTGGARSVVFYGTSPDRLDGRAEGAATSYAYDYSSRPYGTSYASPVLHHVLLTGLAGGTRYYYKLLASNSNSGAHDLSKAPASAKLFDFQLPKAYSFPLRIGVFGDPGQTYNTSTTLERLIAAEPEVLFLTGDFCYADAFVDANTRTTKSQSGTITYGPKWDTWGRLFEPLLSRVPLLHVNGNHEIEQQASGDRNVAYNHRFPTPYLTGHDTSKAPTRFTPASAKGDPFSNLYYSSELPGLAKVISLTSYAPGQTFSKDEAQYTWLAQQLKQTDRSRTPWVIVMIHAPWYHTYASHYKEVEAMRQAYEPLLQQADLVYHGHVHAYERTTPLNNYQVVGCGPVFTTIGDAGNVEGTYKDFIDTQPQPKFCKDPTSTASKAQLFPPKYQPQASFSYQDGRFCFDRQPQWSAYREPSFGFGMLELQSPTRAVWRWYKNQDAAMRVADEVTIDKASDGTCSSPSSPSSSRRAGSGPAAPPSSKSH